MLSADSLSRVLSFGPLPSWSKFRSVSKRWDVVYRTRIVNLRVHGSFAPLVLGSRLCSSEEKFPTVKVLQVRVDMSSEGLLDLTSTSTDPSISTVSLPSSITTLVLQGEATSVCRYLSRLSGSVSHLCLRLSFEVPRVFHNNQYLFDRLLHVGCETTRPSILRLRADHLVVQGARLQYARMQALTPTDRLETLWFRIVHLVLSQVLSVGATRLSCRSFYRMRSGDFELPLLQSLAACLEYVRCTVSHNGDLLVPLLQQQSSQLKSIDVAADTSLDNSSSLFHQVLSLSSNCSGLERLVFDTDSFAAHLVNIAKYPKLCSRVKHLTVPYFHPWSRWCKDILSFASLESLTAVCFHYSGSRETVETTLKDVLDAPLLSDVTVGNDVVRCLSTPSYLEI